MRVRRAKEEGVEALVCVCDDDEWMSPSPRTPDVYCVQTQRNDLGRHTVL